MNDIRLPYGICAMLCAITVIIAGVMFQLHAPALGFAWGIVAVICMCAGFLGYLDSKNHG